MASLHGIVPDEAGRYTLVSFRHTNRGAGRFRVSQWSIHNKLRRILLLHEVRCGLPAAWRHATLASANGGLAAVGYDGRLRPITDAAIAEVHTATMGENLSALVSSDAFLCTLPLYFADGSVHSFVSVFMHRDYCEIGVIREKKLIAVFKMAPGTEKAVEGHIGRIQRYWTAVSPHDPFPDRLYVLNGPSEVGIEGLSTVRLTVKIGNRICRAEEQLRALGCALAGFSGIVPSFPCPKSDPLLRRIRAVGLMGTLAVVIGTALSILIPLTAGVVADLKLKAYERRYAQLITNDREIQYIKKSGDSLARSILRMQKKSARQTQWGRFLEALGASRPEGLYFDKLGSEPVKGSAVQVRMAISGSAKSETSVTDLMARLQKSAPVSNMSLSFLEKNEKNASICNFRILCVMTINGM